MNKIRILHISDLHIAQRPRSVSWLDEAKLRLSFGSFCDLDYENSKASSFCQGKLEELKNLIDKLEPLDGLMVTGDIATTGRRPDLLKARSFFYGHQRELNFDFAVRGFPDLVDNKIKEIMLMPGNHDRYLDSILGFEPGGDDFDEIFIDHWQSKTESWILPADTFEVGVISADFTLYSLYDAEALLFLDRMTFGQTLPKWVCAFAQGKVYEEILKELKIKTLGMRDEIKARNKVPVILWATHFPPAYPHSESFFPQMFYADHLHKLIGEEDLIEAANDCKVSAILCGHVHKRHDYPVENLNCRVYCAGSATQFYAPDGNSCQLFEIGPIDSIEPRIEPIFFTLTEKDGFK